MIVGTDTQQELELTFVGRRTRWRLVRHDSGSVLMAVVDDGATAYREDPLLDLVSRLVPDLFSVGMGLAACANLLEGRARHKVEAAIYRLDEIIAEVRRAAWVEPVTDGATVAPRREVRAPRDLRPYVSSSVSPYPHQHAPDLGESI
jgi:hypothetical protein